MSHGYYYQIGYVGNVLWSLTGDIFAIKVFETLILKFKNGVIFLVGSNIQVVYLAESWYNYQRPKDDLIRC